MPVPLGVRQAFQARVQAIIRDVNDLTEDAVRRALDLAEETRRRVLAQLADLPPEAFTARHLAALKEGLERSIAELVRRYQTDVAGLLERAHELGIDLAEDPLKAAAAAAPGAAIAAVPGLVPRNLLEVLQGYSADLVTNLGAEARRRINGVISQAALGTVQPFDAMQQIAGALPDRSVFKTVAARAEAIYRTEVNRVFSVAAQARMNQMAERLPRLKKRWIAVLDARVRPTHSAAHGQVVPAEATFSVGGYQAQFPRDPVLPASESVNCFPAGTLVLAARIEAAYRRWYSGELVEVATTRGHHLAGTPNHPVLTTRGWLPLGLLHEGDHVVSGVLRDDTVPDPDVEHMPAPIGEVVRSFAEVATLERVAGTHVDFHGDGTDGEVEVVLADRLLRDDVKASEESDEAALVRSLLVDRHLRGTGPQLQTLNRIASAAPSFMSGRDKALTLLGGSPTHPNGHGIPATTERDSGGDQPLPEGCARDPETTSDRLLGFACGVGPDRILQVSRVQFNGHVFNLQTRTGAYLAGGIVAHNCRCHAVPVVDDEVLADLIGPTVTESTA